VEVQEPTSQGGDLGRRATWQHGILLLGGDEAKGAATGSEPCVTAWELASRGGGAKEATTGLSHMEA
jgi:hypothetical protein